MPCPPDQTQLQCHEIPPLLAAQLGTLRESSVPARDDSRAQSPQLVSPSSVRSKFDQVANMTFEQWGS